MGGMSNATPGTPEVRITRLNDHEVVLPIEFVDAVVVALRGSADAHEAERIPHLVAPLRALADVLASR